MEFHENDDVQRAFSERLTLVLDAINELTKIISFDELCRCSVELALERLGFDRVGLCFISADQKTVIGSYGTDEAGKLRNEKHLRRPVSETPTVVKLLEDPEPVIFFNEEVLYNDKVEKVGVGNHAVARLWNGEKIIGICAVDNLIRNNPITDEDLKILVIYGTALGHLFTLKQTEVALRESENKFRTLFEQAAVGVSQVETADGRILKANSRFCAIVGYSPEELSGVTIEELTFLDDIDPERRYFQRMRKGEIREFSLDKRLRHKNGTLVWIHQTTSSMEGSDDGQEYNIVVVQDITTRKRAEEALLESSDFNRLLVETMPFGIDIVDQHGTILFINSTLGNLVEGNVIGRECWSVYKDDQLQCDGCPLRGELDVADRKKLEVNGVLGGRTFQISHVGMMYKGKNATLKIFEDVTEHRKLQSDLLQAQKLHSIGTLAGGIAHDFNNILCIILAYVSAIRKSKDAPGSHIDSLNAINQAVQRGAALVRQVLTFARKTDPAFEVVDVNSLVLELLSMLKRTFPKIIVFSEQLEKNLPFIIADHSKIHQAILNLCVNARDAMNGGGEIVVKTELLARESVAKIFPAAEASSYVGISIIDTGEGMEESTQNRIFDPFFTTKDKGKGTGLGLSVVYGIMQTHNGFIDMKSVPGSGSSFRLLFPAPEKSVEPLDAPYSFESFDAGGTEIILLVEDEDLLLKTVEVMLESHGYTLYVARNGKEAVDVYRRYQDQIDLVVSDIGLPVMTGLEEFRMLKLIDPHLKIILASGMMEPDLKTSLLQEGVSDFIQKPYCLDEMLKKIRTVLDKA